MVAVWLGDQLGVVAALPKDDLRMGLLEVVAAQFGGWYLSGNGEHGNPASLCFVQSIDEMEIAGPATPCAHSQRSGDVSLSPGSERCSFLITNGTPGNIAAGTDHLGDRVQRVASDTINTLHSGQRQCLDQ